MDAQLTGPADAGRSPNDGRFPRITIGEHQMVNRRRPHRPRFSLSFLFALTLICAATLFFFILRPELERQKLIKEIESLGGTVDVDNGESFTLFKSQRIARVTLAQSELKRLTPTRLRVFENLASVVIEDFEFQTETARVKGDKIELDLQNNDSLEELANLIDLQQSASARAAEAPCATLRIRPLLPISLQSLQRTMHRLDSLINRPASRGEPSGERADWK
jgi:hypothetical protein